MNDTTALMTRYLLGELSEREQAELEARYFADPRVFTELADVESALVDDYARGRLTPDLRQRFEAFYLSTPERRERVQFALTLVRAVDRREPPIAALPADAPGWRAWLSPLGGPQLAMAAATLLLLAIGTWFVIDAQRTRQQTTSTRTDDEGRAPVTAVVPPGDTSSAAAPPTNAAPPSPASPPTRPVLAVATLALTVGPGERSGGTTTSPTLTIPAGTDQIRLALSLREHDYARYRVIVRAIGGAEVFRQGDLIPTTGTTPPALALTAPAERFEAGDYMLTLQGTTSGDEYEDLSQTIFRVDRQP